jgi:hypothetical protein
MANLLTLTALNADNPISVTLDNYLDVQEGDGMDPADPSFTDKIFSHSLLKEGGTLALESFALKELVFPLLINVSAGYGGFTGYSAAVALQTAVNQVITSGSPVAAWQDFGLSQPTYFDIASGQVDIEYSFRKGNANWIKAKLRLFAQPFGRTAGARQYAAASGVGPLLLISPYASSGALAIGASTQAGVSGYGGMQQPSGGVFYSGAPSLAGDATAVMQISYAGPIMAGASSSTYGPFTAISVLPDANYNPLQTAYLFSNQYGAPVKTSPQAVVGAYQSFPATTAAPVQIQWNPTSFSQQVPVTWNGLHRIFAIARASEAAGYLYSLGGVQYTAPATAAVLPGDWSLYDLGTAAIRASQPQSVGNSIINVVPPAAGCVDVTALIMLPDANTWFANPYQTASSVYPSIATNRCSLVIDDVVGDQFIGAAITAASRQAPSFAAAQVAAYYRITQATRGLIPRPDPKNGIPIIAILGVGAGNVGATGYGATTNPQNQVQSVQVQILERTRYVLP